MKRINLSKHAFIELPDELPLNSDGNLNIIFQYRWLSSAKPSEYTSIKTVVVYADHPGLNAGNAGELGTADFINKSVEKILTETKAELGKVAASAYSGGGIALYNLFKQYNKLAYMPLNAIILSDATYGGKAVLPVWESIASKYLDSADNKFILLHTRSLEANFDSTTKTAKGLARRLGFDGFPARIDPHDTSEFWVKWPNKPQEWTQKGGLVILDSNMTHTDAGKIVPVLWDSFLSDWY